MDLESQQTITASIAQAKTAGDEIVDRAGSQLAGFTDAAIVHLSIVADALLRNIQKSVGQAIADARGAIEQLDGWTLEVSIPPITIRLSKPKGQI